MKPRLYWLFALLVGCNATNCWYSDSKCGGGCAAPGKCGDFGRYVFVGAGTSQDPDAYTVHPTLVGGTQTLAFSPEGTVESPSRVSLSSPGVMSLQGVTSSSATLRGITPGSVSLQLLSATESLIDQIRLSVVPFSSQTVVLKTYSKLPKAFLAGGQVELQVELGQDAVDESLAVTADAGQVTRYEWYRHKLQPSGPPSVTVTVKASSGLPESTTYPVVAAVESLAATDEEPLVAGLLTVPRTLTVCPYAVAAGQEVLGTSAISVSGLGPIALVPQLDSEQRCWYVSGTGIGAATLTLTLGAVTRTYSFSVGAPLPDLGLDLATDDQGTPLDGGPTD